MQRPKGILTRGTHNSCIPGHHSYTSKVSDLSRYNSDEKNNRNIEYNVTPSMTFFIQHYDVGAAAERSE